MEVIWPDGALDLLGSRTSNRRVSPPTLAPRAHARTRRLKKRRAVRRDRPARALRPGSGLQCASRSAARRQQQQQRRRPGAAASRAQARSSFQGRGRGVGARRASGGRRRAGSWRRQGDRVQYALGRADFEGRAHSFSSCIRFSVSSVASSSAALASLVCERVWTDGTRLSHSRSERPEATSRTHRRRELELVPKRDEPARETSTDVSSSILTYLRKRLASHLSLYLFGGSSASGWRR